QWTHEKNLEKNFYKEYQAYRQHVYEAIVSENPNFQGTRGDLVRITQRFLDRCIFLLFCEDMGKALRFPTDLLRDILIRESLSPTYASGFENIWALVKQLFHAMRDGGPFPPNHEINRFNGGLFEDLGELEQLRIPNRVFCAKGQGESQQKLVEYPDTLLYLSGTYNFGAHGSAGTRTITLYTLGRIFEQSITDLEYMHAEAEGVQTIAKITKRKRDGVYYTPEWVTHYIVQEVVGARLADERERLGLVLGADIPEDEVRKYRRATRKPKSNAATRYVDLLDKYRDFLDSIKILDPACGSGAFLIQALQFLQQHHRDLAAERARITGGASLFDQDAIIRGILGKNLYGVDINPESVEITQLALWLNTASPDKPLTTLDEHIRCGNSLVGPDFRAFYREKHRTLFDKIDRGEQEKVNVFDWTTSFPEALSEKRPDALRGFDCIIGNPPYVKLQHFRKVKPDESDYYIERRNPDGTPVYESAQTGNFDLYLLFIEKGLSLLNQHGRMGYIAPNVWLKNKYGEGLRRYVQRTSLLERWVDFKGFQVFEEATTYTALQFYHAVSARQFRYYLAEEGDLAPLNWKSANSVFDYGAAEPRDAWHLTEPNARHLLSRLLHAHDHGTIADLSEGIFVGIQTSKNDVYHFETDSSGSLITITEPARRVALDPELIHPLVKGPDVKRYVLPIPTTRILVPYHMADARASLVSEVELTARYKKTWEYLRQNESVLRSRENHQMDIDDGWWGYNYPKNIEKQCVPRLMIAGTATGLRSFCDANGEFTQDDRRVFALRPRDESDLWYVLGLLNCPLLNYLFRSLARPKDNGFYDIEKQFIAPLPIPKANKAQKKKVGGLAQRLQTLHTARRDSVAKLQRRIDSPQCVADARRAEWLWADVDPNYVKQFAAAGLSARERTTWTKGEIARRLESHYEEIAAHLRPRVSVHVQADDDALILLVDTTPVLAKYGLEPAEAQYLAALWRQILRGVNITSKFTAEKLVAKLLDLRTTSDLGLRQAILALDAEIQVQDCDIDNAEREINALIYQLYDLTGEEISLVESQQ
ncbi:MAG: Eco57I restriction-modification methylase domain-containing protein, partial [Planctomycetales bacterium]|nr:Eco57I restriction-modification methylase domain-containing protein [Planctomycetales bacterium]